jgi:hypothetical protein
MSVGNLDMHAFAQNKYGAGGATNYGVNQGVESFQDRAASETHSFLSHSQTTMGSRGASLAWKAKNPVHVQGQGKWNQQSTVNFDDPAETPRIGVQ